MKWGYDEIGGELSEEILIKTRLVANNQMYFFAEPKFLGKFFILEDTTMHIKREAFMLEFFAYESIGAAIANVAGIGRAVYV